MGQQKILRWLLSQVLNKLYNNQHASAVCCRVLGSESILFSHISLHSDCTVTCSSGANADSS